MEFGLAIEVTALPVPLLTHHCVQISVVGAKATTATSEAMAVEFHFTGAQQQTENIHALLDLADRHRQPQTQNIRCSGLGFDLSI